MKVYIQIGSSKEKIDFNLKPSETIGDVKAKIAQDREIPIDIQRLFGKYQDIVEDDEYGLKDKTKLYQIDKNGKLKNGVLSFITRHRSSNQYILLYLYSQLKIDVKTFVGFEFSLDFDLDSRLRISSIKNLIYEDHGFPSAMQKLYIGNTDMDELGDHEPICSPQIIEDICKYGLILRLTGKVPLRNITRGANPVVDYPVISATDTIMKIKQKLSPQKIFLYIDGNKIQNLNDNKRLLHYDLRDILSNGLLMKAETPPMVVFVKTLTGKTIAFDCDPGDLVEGLKEKITKKEGIPEKDIRLVYDDNQIGDGQTLSELGIKHESTVDLYIRLRGS